MLQARSRPDIYFLGGFLLSTAARIASITKSFRLWPCSAAADFACRIRSSRTRRNLRFQSMPVFCGKSSKSVKDYFREFIPM